MSRWPTEKHFTSWLTLAPHNKISGGRLLSSKTQPSANRAAAILRMAAMNLLGRSDTALGAFYRRLAYRVGKAKAITATARKLAILVHRTLREGLVYQDPGAAAYDAQHRVRVLHRLRQRAAHLGFSLLNRETGELLEGAVS
jgi:transposase